MDFIVTQAIRAAAQLYYIKELEEQKNLYEKRFTYPRKLIESEEMRDLFRALNKITGKDPEDFSQWWICPEGIYDIYVMFVKRYGPE